MPHPNDYPRAQFILGDLAPALDARRRGEESYGSVAQRDLERYYELLRRSLPEETHIVPTRIRAATCGTKCSSGYVAAKARMCSCYRLYSMAQSK